MKFVFLNSLLLVQFLTGYAQDYAENELIELTKNSGPNPLQNFLNQPDEYLDNWVHSYYVIERIRSFMENNATWNEFKNELNSEFQDEDHFVELFFSNFLSSISEKRF
jgi:hypothetical protein